MINNLKTDIFSPDSCGHSFDESDTSSSRNSNDHKVTVEFISSKRTPRFPIKSHHNDGVNYESISLIKNNNNNVVDNSKKERIPNIKEPLIYRKKDDIYQPVKNLVEGSKKSCERPKKIKNFENFEEFTKLTDESVKDCSNRKFHEIRSMKNSEKNENLQEITSKRNLENKIPNGIEYRDVNNHKNSVLTSAIVHELSSSSESSTEKEIESNSEKEDQCGPLKPSPIHQLVHNEENIEKYNKQINENVVSSSNQQNVVNNKQSQIKHHPQILKTAETSHKDVYFDSPSKLNISSKHMSKSLSSSHTMLKPNSSFKRSLKEVPYPRLSTSSSESSSNYEYQRTLSNSNNYNQSAISPGNSDNGSFISFNSNNNTYEKKIQMGCNNIKFVTKNNIIDKYGTTPRSKSKGFNESLSLSSSNDPIQSLMKPSRSYNSLDVTNSQVRHLNVHSGSLAALHNNGSPQDISGLCHLIQQYINSNNIENIKVLFSDLVEKNGLEKIEDIIDHFEGNERSLLLDIVKTSGYLLKMADSTFDSTMSRSDLHNNLRPGLRQFSLNDSYYQHTSCIEKMVLWIPDVEELLVPIMKPLPKALPTNLLKSAIISSETMQYVDDKVLEILENEITTFTDLVVNLTKEFSKDVERVRALFRWITMYDMKHSVFDPAAPNDTLIGVLRAVKCGQLSYNELFYRMCRYAGIHCQFISGYSKGAGYRPGMDIKENRMFRNVWTAVYVAGAWRLVNCNWGVRYQSKCHTESSEVNSLSSNECHNQIHKKKYHCDEFYFLTDPKQHIFEHFPDKKKWQLLNRPITLDQFMSLPIVKSPFFNANLSFKKNYPETLRTKNGKVTVKMNIPKEIGVSSRFENKADNSIIRGVTLVRIVDNQTLLVTAAPSQPGKFYLTIYVSEDWKSEEELEMACSFQVNCCEHNYDRLVTGRFPEVGVLGSTPIAQKLGLIVNVTVDPFVIWEERSTMKINLIINPCLRICHKMTSYDRTGQNSSPCDSYALLQYHGQDRSQYHIRFPVDTFYCLSIFAGINNFNSLDHDPIELIYRLLVDCRHAQDSIPPFPRQTSRWVGFKLIEPLCQHLEINKVYRFRILSTICSNIVVVINNSKWYDLSLTSEGLWKGRINTGSDLDNLSVYGKFIGDTELEEEGEDFVKLLDYVLVASVNT